jgi:hypothetical protein
MFFILCTTSAHVRQGQASKKAPGKTHFDVETRAFGKFDLYIDIYTSAAHVFDVCIQLLISLVGASIDERPFADIAA